MEVQEIEVVIGKNGEVQIQVHGMQGTACLDLTADLEAALGGQVVERVMTSGDDLTGPEQVQEQHKLKHG